MKYYGLIGYPLSHSFSKKYFTEKFEREKLLEVQYDLYPLENIDELMNLLRNNPGLCGLNVTIPHKINVLKLLDWVETDAKAAGAVNCIRVTSESPITAAFLGEVGVDGHDFRLEGFNTDLYGFDKSLTPLLKKQHTKALVLGDGGAARAVKCVLHKKNIVYTCVTRHPDKNSLLYEQVTADIVADYKLIINTTPVGMYPNMDDCPQIAYAALTPSHLLYDLIYNPDETLFLRKGKEHGAATKNGYEMLILQAEKSWEIWNSKTKHP
jgi:shikimate dehydrogenase